MSLAGIQNYRSKIDIVEFFFFFGREKIMWSNEVISSYLC